jgi:hypothetical protein
MRRLFKETKWLLFEDWTWMEWALLISGFIAMFRYLS